MEQRVSRTGFYGKLVTHGDFLSRRLSPTFVRGWDDWLQAGLRASEQGGNRPTAAARSGISPWPPTLLVSRGLPGAGWFVGMLGGEGGGAA
ncbi:type VI secretion system-associated protein TagF [Pseudomonas sp. MH2]|uniref:Type VI secretion system-associated protein TagF n=1 Tax=Pseudomonas machongensis TaxID=3110229 RepID=A0ABU5VD38_9PSED|nr:type VI secretion system-associated protein TagF [Pseudomonas sp. MH2]MEA5671269.1 type VI secretion system-associated protein TagF [Pseudomonas sp. MH2]